MYEYLYPPTVYVFTTLLDLYLLLFVQFFLPSPHRAGLRHAAQRHKLIFAYFLDLKTFPKIFTCFYFSVFSPLYFSFHTFSFFSLLFPTGPGLGTLPSDIKAMRDVQDARAKAVWQCLHYAVTHVGIFCYLFTY